jgi:hypothetical protein
MYALPRATDQAETTSKFSPNRKPRRFTQAELDWRAENAPWNLRRDFKTNISWDRECADRDV